MAFIINTAPGYKKKQISECYKPSNWGTRTLQRSFQKPIYLDENGVVYMSKEDIQQLLDKTFLL